MIKRLTFLVALMCALTATSQINSLQQLPEVVLSDVKLQKNSTGIHVQKISDSVAKKSRTNLTALLQDNSLLYFRENGPGGVSSASFRGTNAQQTAVVWNGININSLLTGQTDFSTISSKNYHHISVRPGGGSIIYGSGAVGGSIHLENSLLFNKGLETNITAGYGSFNTQVTTAKTSYSKNKLSIDLAADYQFSDNDFKYLDTDSYNENGGFENLDIAFNLGYKLASLGAMSNVLKVHHNTYLGNRDFSGTLTAPSDDAYEDRTTKTLVKWDHKSPHYSGKFHTAHIFEQFKYFGNNENRDQYSLGKAIRFIGHYEADIKIDKTKAITLSGELNSIAAAGSSIQKASRTIAAAVALWKHKLSSRFTYEVQARQEFIEEYNSPFLIGLGMEYAFAKANTKTTYLISLNASRNYRIPTFNDRYWQGPGATGNLDLRPETSIQVAIGHEIKYKGLTVALRNYFLKTQDLIKWQPDSNGLWSPVNIAETQHFGLETAIKYDKKLGSHYLTSDFQYGYTIAKDIATQQQLIYVPKHKGILSIAHRYKWLGLFMQNVVNGSVFTTSDNTSSVDEYYIANVGLTAHLLHTNLNAMTITARVNNTFNTNYQTVALRPNPGRNFFIQTTYTF